MDARVLIGGIGNIFLGDDAFGSEVVRRLAQQPLPEGVRLIDFGIRGMDLAYALMEGYELSILVDAMPRNGIPGTIYVLEPDGDGPESVIDETPLFDPHSMDPQKVLALVRTLGGRCGRLVVVGCEPSPLTEEQEEQIGLSAPVKAAIEEAIQAINSLLSGFLTSALPHTGADAPLAQPAAEIPSRGTT